MSRNLLIGFLLLAPLAMAGLPDPMRPGHAVTTVPAKQAKQTPRYVLYSILISPQRRVAMINDQLVSQGDRIQQARVLRIETNRVLLVRDNGKRLTLELLPNDPGTTP